MLVINTKQGQQSSFLFHIQVTSNHFSTEGCKNVLHIALCSVYKELLNFETVQ